MIAPTTTMMMSTITAAAAATTPPTIPPTLGLGPGVPGELVVAGSDATCKDKN